MEEAISNSIKELSIIIESEPELIQVAEETIVTDNNTENDTVEQKRFGPLIVICKDLTQEKEETNSHFWYPVVKPLFYLTVSIKALFNK